MDMIIALVALVGPFAALALAAARFAADSRPTIDDRTARWI